MGMTLDEAIIHNENVAEYFGGLVECCDLTWIPAGISNTPMHRNYCIDLAQEGRQTAEWLKELKGYRSIKDQIYFAKRNIQSENSDFLTGYLSALSAVEGMIAEVENAESEDKVCIGGGEYETE